MQAMVLRQPGPIEAEPLMLSDVPQPEPGDDELLLRIEACGVCRTDLHQVEGDLPMIRSPVVPGHEIVGRVIDSGAGIEGGTPERAISGAAPSLDSELRFQPRFKPGDRVGVAWLHDACGACGYCRGGRENLCGRARFTGWSVNGGYAEAILVPAAFAYAIPDGFAAEKAAPLLCAGIIGYRALRATGIEAGQRLGLYGFGASAHVTIQVAVHERREVYVVTRSEANQALALRLGAVWAGGAEEPLPAKLHASIMFAPSGALVLTALEHLAKAGTLVLAGIHMTPVPELNYRRHLYDEKCLRSVANATRRDGEALLGLGASIPIRTSVTTMPLASANVALAALKHGRITGSAVLAIV